MISELRRNIRTLSLPLAEKLGLTKISDFADIIVFSFLFFTAVHVSLSPLASKLLFPVAYGKAGRRARNNWDIHVVSLVHALAVIILAGQCLGLSSLDADRAFGWDNKAGYVQAIACGYFLWDSLDAMVHFIDVGFVCHGIACLAIYTLGFKPFLAYYGVRFLFWELSTVFLNIHWFLDHTGKTGSTLQFVNGTVLLLTFSCVRLLWGGKMSYDFFHTLQDVSDQLPFAYIVIYGGGNVILQALNWFWFVKMISALRKRFTSPKSNGYSVPNGNGKLAEHID
ncbi:DUF887-domain-containing protein [Hygrophoropsis aurantiaca]|uniref:DUF887-domain-containing protein n=1 Tax=Hygrophoropsis aurantiaca TaxID=72124 RepID=A0ACB8ACA0_9AGAM|nr:DUF887-domain-containing protein [Hygrophoropsis aurantiaca]